MAIIPATVTTDARQYWASMLAGGPVNGVGSPGTPTVIGTTWDPRIKTFCYGEGGWLTSGLGKVARTPDPALRRLDTGIQAMDWEVDQTRALIDQRYIQNPLSADYSIGSYEKALDISDFTYESPNTLRVRCFLDYPEFNEDYAGSGRNPEIWELALFSDHPTQAGQKLMVAYATFPMETKNVARQIENVIRLVW
jgi:hypothetical protein